MATGPGQIIGSRVDGTTQRVYMADVTSQGALCISGVVSVNGFTGSITIGSVSAHVDSIYVASGVTYVQDNLPNSIYSNNPAMVLEYISSGTSTGLSTGSEIGTVVQFVGAGSYVKTLTYSNNNLVGAGSWV